MGGEAATSPNKPRSGDLDERDEGEGEDIREPPTEVVEEEGAIKEEVEWVAGIIFGNSVWDGNLGHPTRGDDQDSRRTLIVVILEFCITYLPDVFPQSTKP